MEQLMMSTLITLSVTLFAFRCYGYTSCPLSQQPDTNRICQIFLNTNIEQLSDLYYRNFSDDNYCNWGSDAIQCESINNVKKITRIIISGLVGYLDFTYPWPGEIIEIDLEQLHHISPSLIGEFEFRSLQNLKKLQELDLEDNMFRGVITNKYWNMIADFPSLTDLVLTGNEFECNFSEITLNTKSQIYWLELKQNNFYGTLNDEFFNMFPNLIELEIKDTDLYAHFDNLDIFADLLQIELLNNHFSGTVTLSDGINFPYNMRDFQIDYNDFSSEIEWRIFEQKYYLETFGINHNSFTGTINWTILADLYHNGNLNYIDLRNNNFTGYADFSWLTDSIIEIDLDVNVHCDPAKYPCTNGKSADRTQVYCYTKEDCEATCQCVQTESPTAAFPTTMPTISPSAQLVATYVLDGQSEQWPINITNVSYALIIILTLVCIALCCIIIGFIIGCYCISYRKRLNEAQKMNVTNGIDMHNSVYKSYRKRLKEAQKTNVTNGVAMHNSVYTGGLPKLDPTLPSLPKEQLYQDGDNNEQYDNGVIRLNSGVNNSMYKTEGKMELTNYVSASNSEALYVHQSPHRTKGKLAFDDKTSLTIQPIDETFEDV